MTSIGAGSWSARFARGAIGFVLMMCAYWLYATVVVPSIEPAAHARHGDSSTVAERQAAGNINHRYLKLFARYFPEDHWARKNPKVLINEQCMLLIDDYTPLDDGRVELRPCVMIFFPQPQDKELQPQRRAILLDAPEGAVLKFDEGLDLTHARIGRLEYGQLNGKITIHSDMRQEGPEDDLRVVTREVEMSPSRIWTAHDVHFRMGENWGYGSEMEIRLLPVANRGKQRGLSIGGLQSLQLARKVKMNFALGDAGLLPASPATEPSVESKKKPPQPVEISCRGPFFFDLVRHVATFEEHVDVLRVNPVGPGDQMTCELLSVFFEPKEKNQENDPKEESSLGGVQPLEPTRMEAIGAPVVVRSPASEALARCEQLVYDLGTRKIELSGEHGVALAEKRNEIHAPAVHYQPSDKPGGLGTVWAAGPGWLRAVQQKKPDQPFEVRWQEELHLRRHEGAQVISVQGRPRLSMQGMGKLDADEVHLWLQEVAAAAPESKAENESESSAPKQDVQPERMLATGDVLIDSTQLTGITERLEAWFEPELPPQADTPTEPPQETVSHLSPAVRGAGEPALLAEKPAEDAFSTPPGRRHVATLPRTQYRTPRAAPPLDRRAPWFRRQDTGPMQPQPDASALPQQAPPKAAADALRPRGDDPPCSGRADSKYDIRGDLIRLKVATGEETTEVSDVTVEGSVHLTETQTAELGQRPLVVRGDRLEMKKVHQPATTVNVAGKPAHVEARGLSLDGEEIKLDRGANRLWIDGQGVMTLPIHRGEDEQSGQPPPPAEQPQPQTLRIDWKGKMNFDGLLLRFEKQVAAQTATQNLQTEELEVELTKRIDFAQGSQSTRPELHQLICRKGVQMENRTLEKDRLLAIDRLSARSFVFNQTSGDMHATGPGSVTSVRLGGQDPLLSGTATTRPVSTPVEPEDQQSRPEQLNYLQVDFHKAMQGNSQRRRVEFTGHVRSVYGPVDRWQETIDGSNPDKLGEHGVVLSCDQLNVTELKPYRDRRGTIELEAVGNTLVEGQTFTARAARIGYVQAKELLVLEGSGRTDAQLWRQEFIGGETSYAAAKKILYWRRNGHVQIQSASSFGGQSPVK